LMSRPRRLHGDRPLMNQQPHASVSAEAYASSARESAFTEPTITSDPGCPPCPHLLHPPPPPLNSIRFRLVVVFFRACWGADIARTSRLLPACGGIFVVGASLSAASKILRRHSLINSSHPRRTQRLYLLARGGRGCGGRLVRRLTFHPLPPSASLYPPPQPHAISVDSLSKAQASTSRAGGPAATGRLGEDLVGLATLLGSPCVAFRRNGSAATAKRLKLLGPQEMFRCFGSPIPAKWWGDHRRTCVWANRHSSKIPAAHPSLIGSRLTLYGRVGSLREFCTGFQPELHWPR